MEPDSGHTSGTAFLWAEALECCSVPSALTPVSFFYLLCVGVWPARVRVSDSPELELQTGASCQVGTRNRTSALKR